MRFTPEIWQFIREHRQEDVRTLALQSDKYPHLDMPAIANQIAGWQTAQHKIPSWHATEGIIYPSHLALEQCSSEATATFKASLLKGETLVDLTGGFGIDCAFLSTGFKHVTYVEQQQELCDTATHNFAVLGLHHIAVRQGDSVDMLLAMLPVDCIFIDPARRNAQGGKTVLISDCEPDVEALEMILMQKAKQVMIKLSPMLDLTMALRSLQHTVEVCVVSVQNECKELLLMLSASTAAEPVPRIQCINLTGKGIQRFEFTAAEEAETPIGHTGEVGTYLYEPNASILKAGAFRSVAARFRLTKLHPNSHLYTSDIKNETFPGRCFEVEAVGALKDKKMFEGLTQANITVRNFPMSVAELRKRTKLKDGGSTYLFATTLNNNKKVLIRGKRL